VSDTSDDQPCWTQSPRVRASLDWRGEAFDFPFWHLADIDVDDEHVRF